MKLLYASMMLPCPPTFGKRMEIWTTLRALADAGHEVTLVSFHDSGQEDIERIALTDVCRAVFLVPLQLTPPRSFRDYGDRLRALLDPDPHQAFRYRSKAFTKCIAERLRAECYDAIICGEVFVQQNMPPDLCIPVILKKDHVATTILRRYVASEGNLARKLYGWLEWAKMRRWEPGVCRRATAIMACSELERDQLQALCPRVPVTLGPNVVDLNAYGCEGAEDENTILYHGLMDWFPNQDAVSFFISDVLPRLRQLAPNVRLVVAGRTSSPKFAQRFSHVPGVEFVGTVPDMRVYIRQCAVCIVPLRIASGTRFKILEAAALARPVVSTQIGAEGLSFTDGEEILIADQPEAFARQVAVLLNDPSRRRAIGLAAKKRVGSDYSFSSLCRGLEDTLRLIVSTPLPRPDMAHSSK